MKKKILEKMFFHSKKLFFEKISPKYQTSPFKNLMDYLYIIFEKVGYNFNFIIEQYLEMYNELVEKEIKMGNISRKNKILVIGCGSIPATPLLISKKTNAKIEALDCDVNAVKKSTNLLITKFPEQKIKILLSGAIEHPMKNFDFIFILYGVKKQKEIIKRIYQKINKETQIILRTTKDTFQKNVGKEFLLKYYNIEKSVKSEELKDVESLLLSKKT